MKDCRFCARVADGDYTTGNEHAVAFADTYPVSPGHTLVIPRHHVADLFDIDPEARADMWRLVELVHADLLVKQSPQGFNIGVNVLEAAGQTIAHAHIHVIPRYHGDVTDPRGGVRWVIPEKANYWDGATNERSSNTSGKSLHEQPTRSRVTHRDTDGMASRLAKGLEDAFPTWPVWQGGWPGEADAALVDAIFSTLAHYDSTVLPLVQRWRTARTARDLGNGVSALVRGGRDFLSETLDNGQYVPGRAKKLKVDAVLEVAARLLDPAVGLDTAEQITERALANRGEVRQIVEGVKGVGPAQSAYFLMLLGVQGVKADTLVTDWVRQQLGDQRLTQHEIETVVARAAELLGKNAIEVDHAIWRIESNRRRRHRTTRSSTREAVEPYE